MEASHTDSASASPPSSDDARHDGTAPTAARLGERVKSRVAEVRAQLQAAEAVARERLAPVPGALRSSLQQALGRVRDALDLPTRRDLDTLSDRLDALDRKLDAAETQRGDGDGARTSSGPADWS